MIATTVPEISSHRALSVCVPEYICWQQLRSRDDRQEMESVIHSETLPSEQAGELLNIPRQRAEWGWMSFFVRRLSPGDTYRSQTDREEAGFVLLGGRCQADWGKRPQSIGKRKNVFDGYPYALYLPSGNAVTFT